MSTSAPVPRQLAAYLDCLFAAEPPGFAELRWRLRSDGMGREFVALGDHGRLAAVIVARGRSTDLYVGVAPRVRQEGGRDAVERVHALWVDCDSSESIKALEHFDAAPSMVVRSGSGRHAYWSLWPPLEPESAERANRRLAHALGADSRATDAARILRPPGPFNFKTGEPRPVELEHLTDEIYDAPDLVEHLADPPQRRREVSGPRTSPDDPLLAVPPPVYVEALTGLEVGREGKVACPFHADSTPSLHAYDDPERGFTCFGCGRAGSIIDFGAALWGIEPRGAGYHEVRRRLEAELLPALRRVAA